MRFNKWYFLVIATIFVVSIVCIFYIWAKVQSLNDVEPSFTEVSDLKEQDDTVVSGDEVGGEEASSTREPVTVDIHQLPESQQTILKNVGIDTSFTITAEMEVCAEEKLGRERLDEIIAGSAPTPLETLTLLPCARK